MSNTALTYTISIDGIEKMLTQLGQLEKAIYDLEKDFDGATKGTAGLKKSLDDLGQVNKSATEAANGNTAALKSLKTQNAELQSQIKKLADTTKDSVKSQKDLKKSQQEATAQSAALGEALTAVQAPIAGLGTDMKSLAGEVSKLASKLDEPKDKLKQFEESFTKSVGNVKQTFSSAAEGYDALKKAAGNLNGDLLKGFSAEVVKGFNSNLSQTDAVFEKVESGVTAFTGAVKAGESAIGAMKIVQQALNLVMKANPIGLIVAGITALIAVGASMVAIFSGNTKAAEQLNSALDEQNKTFAAAKDGANKYIELMKLQGKTEEEIAAAKKKLIADELALLSAQHKQADAMYKTASNSQKEIIKKKIEDIENSERKLNYDLLIIGQEHINQQVKLNKDAHQQLIDLTTSNIKNRQQRESQQLEQRQAAETADFNVRLKGAKEFNDALKQLDEKHARETQELKQKFIEENSAVKVLNASISQLMDQTLNQYLRYGNASKTVTDELLKKQAQLANAYRQLQQLQANNPGSIDQQVALLNQKMEAQRTAAEEERQQVNESALTTNEKEKEKLNISIRTFTILKDLQGQKIALDKNASEEDKEEFNQLSNRLLSLNGLLQDVSTLKLEALGKSDTIETFHEQILTADQALKGLDQSLKGFKENADKPATTDKATITNSLGLDAEGQTELNNALQKVQQAVSQTSQAIGSIFQAQKENKLHDIQEQEDREIASVENSSGTEQQKAAKIDAIKKAAADKAHKAEVEEKKKKQKLDIITGIINTALAVTQALAGSPPPVSYVMAAIAAATGAIQVGVVANQQFARGGIIPFEEGGMIQGPSHAEGGVPFVAGGAPMEAEGGELIVNRNIWRRPDFVKSISAMNSITGGRRFFAAGGVIPSPSIPGVSVPQVQMPAGFDTDTLLKGLRGVIANEVGSIKVINNVVNTTDQQTRILNQQVNSKF